jgi:hypothetical protein
MAIGAVALLAGVVGLLVDRDPAPGDEVSVAATSASSSTSTTLVSTTSILAVETPQAFYDAFAAAMQAGDVDVLVGRLHPTTFDRYDDATCRAYLAAVIDADFTAAVTGTAPPARWSWTTDGLERDIDDAIAVRVRIATGEQETHLAPVDGQLRWFTDCGNPKEGAR